MEVTCCTVAITSRLAEVAPFLTAFVAQNWHGFGVEQKEKIIWRSQLFEPCATKLLDQQTQGARAAIELALVTKLWEQLQIVGAHEGEKLGLTFKREKVHRQH